jgi:glycosyltransferase involved in cell wall biosynthesis/GT2 family glycosyltransferase
MLKVVAVVDKVSSAIDRLAKSVSKYHDNINYVVIDVHPKRPSQDQIAQFEREAIDADIIDFAYYKTAEMLLSRYEWLKSKKKMLQIHNPYCVGESDWNSYDIVVSSNKEIYSSLEDITASTLELIPLTIDTDFWAYNTEWSPNNNVIMVAARIESKKGILEVAKACQDLNLNFHLVGSISKPDYFMEIMQVRGVTFHEKITDEELRDLYYKSTIHVCNSVDNFESGTMPILEAGMCGVPILTRKIGHVPDLFNGTNMVINEAPSNDIESIKNHLKEMIMDKKKLMDMRDEAWNSFKGRSDERRAYQFQKLYRQLMDDSTIPVSVVVPIYDKPDIARKCLDAIARQTYHNIEVIVVDDNPLGILEGNSPNEKLVDDFRQFVSFPVRYINTAQVVVDRGHADGYSDYGLARARNIGTIEATGELMVYCDTRQIMAEDCIEQLVKYAKPRYWVFGNKGGNKKSFVENLSCIYREDIINAGMFSERGIWYGYQSQELRYRIRNQGISTEYVESARAVPAGKSSNRNQKRNDIVKSKNMLYKMGLDR